MGCWIFQLLLWDVFALGAVAGVFLTLLFSSDAHLSGCYCPPGVKFRGREVCGRYEQKNCQQWVFFLVGGLTFGCWLICTLVVHYSLAFNTWICSETGGPVRVFLKKYFLATWHPWDEVAAVNDNQERLLSEEIKVAIRNADEGPLDYFISHRQADTNIYALELHTSFKELGLTSWLDVKAEEADEQAMEAGVRDAEFFILIASDGYFKSGFCVKELRWAKKYNKPIIPCHKYLDKPRIGQLLASCPPDIREGLGGINFISLNRDDPEFWEVTMNKIRKAPRKTL